MCVCEKAIEVITKGLERLKDLRTRAKPGFKPIGVELFRKLIRARFIEEDIGVLRNHGYREANKCRMLMERAAKEMGVRNIKEGLNKLKEKHVTSGEDVIKYYEGTLEKVRRFVVEKEVVESPPLESVKIVETPEFMRPIIPFAAYIPPEVLSWSFRGFFLVTKPLNEEMLKHHNIYDI